MSFQAKNIQHFIAKPGETVYFTFSRGVQNPIKRRD